MVKNFNFIWKFLKNNTKLSKNNSTIDNKSKNSRLKAFSLSLLMINSKLNWTLLQLILDQPRETIGQAGLLKVNIFGNDFNWFYHIIFKQSWIKKEGMQVKVWMRDLLVLL